MKDSPSIFGKAYRKAERDWRSLRRKTFKRSYSFLRRHWHSDSNPSRPPVNVAESAFALPKDLAKVESIQPATKYARVTPILSPGEESFKEFLETEYQDGELYVAELPNGRVFAPSTAMTSGHTLLQREAFEFNVHEESDRSIFHRMRMPTLQKVSGTVGLVASDDIQNYHHWLFYTLPRIGMILRSGSADQATRFLVNRVDKSFQKQSLERLGISQDRLLFSEEYPYLEAEKLLVTPAPIPTRHSQFSVDFVRQTFLGSDSNPDRLIYLGRGSASTRKCLNEDEVMQVLGGYGFEFVSMDGRTVAEQAELMSESKIVIAPHGAAMTNIVFMNPGSIVLEFAHEHLNIRFFWDLASRVGLKYSYLPTSLSPSENKKILPFMYDFKVDIERLKQRVSQLLERTEN